MADKTQHITLPSNISQLNEKCWCGEHGELVEISDVAIAPSKDFYNIFVTKDKVIVRIWKIVPPHRSDHPPPVEYKDTFQEFLEDDRCQSEVQRVGGTSLLNYLVGIVEGHVDFLSRIPPKVIEKILLKCDLQDIRAVSQTNKFFRDICNSDSLWEKIYRVYSETPVTAELQELANERGWKRLFFTNKLQLQMQIRRMKDHGPTGPPPGGYAFMTSEPGQE